MDSNFKFTVDPSAVASDVLKQEYNDSVRNMPANRGEADAEDLYNDAVKEANMAELIPDSEQASALYNSARKKIGKANKEHQEPVKYLRVLADINRLEIKTLLDEAKRYEEGTFWVRPDPEKAKALREKADKLTREKHDIGVNASRLERETIQKEQGGSVSLNPVFNPETEELNQRRTAEDEIRKKHVSGELNINEEYKEPAPQEFTAEELEQGYREERIWHGLWTEVRQIPIEVEQDNTPTMETDSTTQDEKPRGKWWWQ